MQIKTEDYVLLTVAILGAMPPGSDFCKIIKSLAETDAWSDFMDIFYAQDGDWDQDKGKLIGELKAKFGDEIELGEVIDEWEKQAG